MDFIFDYESESDNRYEPDFIVPFVNNHVLVHFKFVIGKKRQIVHKNRFKRKKSVVC
jgi:hypothetical protein